jgi:hypothetical protein
MTDHVITAEEFEELDDFNKGYAVYMYGDRDDQPNVPRTCDCDSADYHAGQRLAVVHVTDMEE